MQVHVQYLTDIPRQREEYEVIYGTRWNAECHITSILQAGEEYLLYYIPTHNPEWCIRKHISNYKKIKVNSCSIIQNICSKDMYDTVRFIVIYEN